MVNAVGSTHLLTAKQMAMFARDGFLLLEDLVPQELNEAVHRDQQQMTHAGYHFWEKSDSLREVFALPQVVGAIESLVGPNSTYNHSYLHIVKPKQLTTQNWHVDSGVMNTNPHAFDVQAFYFAHDTPKEMGPTLVLPGSHLRRADYWSISRYKNIAGQRHLSAKSGSIAFTHQDIWHCAQPNYTDQMRYVFKLRLDPVVEQNRLFNLEGCDDPEIMEILNTPYAWYGVDYQKEFYIKKKFWASLTEPRA